MREFSVDEIKRAQRDIYITLCTPAGLRFCQEIKPGGRLILPLSYENATIYGQEGKAISATFWSRPLSPTAPKKSFGPAPSPAPANR